MDVESTGPVSEELLDEARFHNLLRTNLMYANSEIFATREDEERDTKAYLEANKDMYQGMYYLAAEEVPKLLNRYHKYPHNQWIKDWGPLSMLDTVKALNLTSTNQDLRRMLGHMRFKIYRKGALPEEVGWKQLIRCPDGVTRSYKFNWELGEGGDPFEDERMELPPITMDQLELWEKEKGLEPEPGDLNESERYLVPEGTVVRIMTPSGNFVCVPVGELDLDHSEWGELTARWQVARFWVVWFLESRKFGIVYNSDSYEGNEVEQKEGWNFPHTRLGNFVPDGVPVSVGVLRGFSEEPIATLERIEANGYYAVDVARLGGVIQTDPKYRGGKQLY